MDDPTKIGTYPVYVKWTVEDESFVGSYIGSLNNPLDTNEFEGDFDFKVKVARVS